MGWNGLNLSATLYELELGDIYFNLNRDIKLQVSIIFFPSLF